MKILLGTNNPNKRKELRDIFGKSLPGQIELISPSELNISADVEETGITLEENAILKAKYFYEASFITTLAEDTGLEIDFLGGEPGVYSARYSGVHGDDAANRLKVLNSLRKVPFEERSARFKTVICFYEINGPSIIEGTCEGHIAFEEKGVNGFGYDRIFIPDSYEMTFAELTSDEKNKISHRAKAVMKLIDFIKHKKLT
jgi:XTP/dITP diphosphohydrolase